MDVGPLKAPYEKVRLVLTIKLNVDSSSNACHSLLLFYTVDPY